MNASIASSEVHAAAGDLQLLVVLQGECNDTLAVFDEEDYAERWADRYNSRHAWSSGIDRARVIGGIFVDANVRGVAEGARLFLAEVGSYEETTPVGIFADEVSGHRWVDKYNTEQSWLTGGVARLNTESVPFNPPLSDV